MKSLSTLTDRNPRNHFQGHSAGVRQGGQSPPPQILDRKLMKEWYFSVQCSDYCRVVGSVMQSGQMPPPPPLNFESGYGPGSTSYRWQNIN